MYAGEAAPERDGEKAVAKSAGGLFFGYPIQALSAFGSTLSLNGSSEKAVADGWRALATDDNASFFKDYSEYSGRWQLNDWGRYLLLRQAGEKLHAGYSSDDRVLFLFYTLSRSGYRVKIGRTGNDALVLLLPFEEEVYRLPYIRVDGLKYYVVDAPGKLQKLYSIGRDYQETHQTVSLKIRQGMRFPDDPVVRKFTGKYGFSVPLNWNLIDFYASYPLCDLSVYFESKPSAAFEGEMDRIVKKQLVGKTWLEQVAWLLDFVQQSVVHRPDEAVHGKEVYYFPEETLFHPYADCEDLSVFLSWLLSRYVTGEVVILYYPTHVTVAVEKTGGYEGNVVSFIVKSN